MFVKRDGRLCNFGGNITICGLSDGRNRFLNGFAFIEENGKTCLDMTVIMQTFLMFFGLSIISSSLGSPMSEIRSDILYDIDNHKVMVYSKTYCPYSKRLKKILSGYKISDLKIVELDLDSDMRDMQEVLSGLSGRKTVPQLFIDGQFVGGHDETKAMDMEGKLREMLQRARAI